MLNSDDYWVFERLKRYSSRMTVIPIRDLPKDKAMSAFQCHRRRYFNQDVPASEFEQVYDLVGGRLSYLNRVARSTDMLAACRSICETEKTWFYNKCGILGSDMDDDVMDQQKYAVSLFKPLVSPERYELNGCCE